MARTEKEFDFCLCWVDAACCLSYFPFSVCKVRCSLYFQRQRNFKEPSQLETLDCSIQPERCCEMSSRKTAREVGGRARFVVGGLDHSKIETRINRPRLPSKWRQFASIATGRVVC